MVSTSKVLTVSYGTFSCTLEGFDDSFDTMKAIAEYFRDLAADDRYFGAEPPTPDAEMLARIAEKEIARRVEARLDGGNIVLSTSHPENNAPAIADAADGESPETAHIAEETEGDTEQPAADTSPDDLVSNAAEATAPEVSVDQAEAEDAQTPEPQATETTAASGDDTDNDPEAALQSRRARRRAQRLAALVQTPIEVSTQAHEDTQPSEPTHSEATPVAEPEEQTTSDDDSVAAKLARIRAVVGKPAEQAETPSYSEDEHAEEILDTLPGDTDLADILPEDEAEIDLPEVQAPQSSLTSEVAEDTIANVIDRLSDTPAQVIQDEQPTAEEPVAQDSSQDAAPQNAPDVDLSAISAQIEAPAVEESETESEPQPEAASAEPLPESEDAIAQDAPQIEDPAPQVPQDAPAPDAAQSVEGSPLRARVIKMKRAEFEAALANGQIEETEDDSDDASGSQQPESSLSDEDEAELQRELAAVEAELMQMDAEEDTDLSDVQQEPLIAQDPVAYEEDDEQEAEVATQVTAERGQDDLNTSPDAEVDRLISQADEALEEPESKQRRSAMGHLRAAVAAARADNSPDAKAAAQADEVETYREDLGNVMKPRRPVRRVTSEGATARPAPPPLKLVAEQRIDMPAEGTPAAETPARPANPVRPVRPVRPTRGARRAMEAQSEAPAQPDQDFQPPEKTQALANDAGSFQEFAESMGATELPDLLEAAASYLAHVEGRDQFSRPQLMTKVRMVQEENFSREDGLRSFGQLLRAGKIAKISGGRFTVSESTGFKPDTRAAG